MDMVSGKQMSGDYCIPAKAGGCSAFCPTECATWDQMCPGGMDAMGCPMPDTCYPAKGKLNSSTHSVEKREIYYLYKIFRQIASCVFNE